MLTGSQSRRGGVVLPLGLLLLAFLLLPPTCRGTPVSVENRASTPVELRWWNAEAGEEEFLGEIPGHASSQVDGEQGTLFFLQSPHDRKSFRLESTPKSISFEVYPDGRLIVVDSTDDQYSSASGSHASTATIPREDYYGDETGASFGPDDNFEKGNDSNYSWQSDDSCQARDAILKSIVTQAVCEDPQLMDPSGIVHYILADGDENEDARVHCEDEWSQGAGPSQPSVLGRFSLNREDPSTPLDQCEDYESLLSTRLYMDADGTDKIEHELLHRVLTLSRDHEATGGQDLNLFSFRAVKDGEWTGPSSLVLSSGSFVGSFSPKTVTVLRLASDGSQASLQLYSPEQAGVEHIPHIDPFNAVILRGNSRFQIVRDSDTEDLMVPSASSTNLILESYKVPSAWIPFAPSYYDAAAAVAAGEVFMESTPLPLTSPVDEK